MLPGTIQLFLIGLVLAGLLACQFLAFRKVYAAWALPQAVDRLSSRGMKMEITAIGGSLPKPLRSRYILSAVAAPRSWA
jgi:hypothetical protein